MDKFSYEANGYNRDEVNQFVNDVIKETEDIVKRVESQRDEIIYLKKVVVYLIIQKFLNQMKILHLMNILV